MASCYGYISRAFAAANQVRIPVLGNASVARPSSITTERSEGRQVIPAINTDIWESMLKQSVHRLPITGSPRKGNAADPLQAFSPQVWVYFPHRRRSLLCLLQPAVEPVIPQGF